MMVTCGFVITIASVGGCRHSGPVVEMVNGVVTLDGAPLEGVIVTFHPVDGAGLLAVGMTQADGRYTLNATRGGRPGAGTAMGAYVVTLAKTQGGYEIINSGGQAALATPPDTEAETAAYEKWAREQEANQPRPIPPLKHLIPEAYGDVETSGFRVGVKKGRNTGPEFEFKLRSDFRGVGAN